MTNTDKHKMQYKQTGKSNQGPKFSHAIQKNCTHMDWRIQYFLLSEWFHIKQTQTNIKNIFLMNSVLFLLGFESALFGLTLVDVLSTLDVYLCSYLFVGVVSSYVFIWRIMLALFWDVSNPVHIHVNIRSTNLIQVYNHVWNEKCWYKVFNERNFLSLINSHINENKVTKYGIFFFDLALHCISNVSRVVQVSDLQIFTVLSMLHYSSPGQVNLTRCLRI